MDLVNLKEKVPNVVSINTTGNQVHVFTEYCFDSDNFEDLMDYMEGFEFSFLDTVHGVFIFGRRENGQ